MKKKNVFRTQSLTRRQNRDVSSLVSIRAIAFTAIAPHVNLHSTPRHSVSIAIFYSLSRASSVLQQKNFPSLMFATAIQKLKKRAET
jgi:hypothetical protein